jgi:uncharacterized protein
MQGAASTAESLVDVVRSLVVGDRPRFHAFTYRGSRILYDVVSGTLLEPSAVAFALLEGLENGHTDSEIQGAIAAIDPTADIGAVRAEIALLSDLGLFQQEDADTPDQRESVIQAHLSHHPRNHHVFVQTSCNLRCAYCYEVQSGFHGSGRSMDFETGKKSIEYFFKASGPRHDLTITFFGGEPLLAYGLVKRLVEYSEARAKELGKSITFKITTNATLLSAEIIEFLVDKPFAVMVSLDGPPELADKYRVDSSGKGTTRKALENAKRLISAQRAHGRREAAIRATLAHGNHSLLTVARFFEDQGFRRVMIGSSAGRAHGRQLHDLGPDEMFQMDAELDQGSDLFLESLKGGSRPPTGLAIEKSIRMLFERINGQLPPVRTVMCGVGSNMVAITAEGDLYPCHRYVGEVNYRIGSLDHGSDKRRLRKFYAQILEGYDRHCSSCWARALCGGQCPWYLSRPDGTVGLPDKECCDRTRMGMERMLGLFSKVRDSARARGLTSREMGDDEEQR